METHYKTILLPSEAQHKVMGSKHLAFAYPVESEEEIKYLIAALRKEHHSATHVCYAWQLGPDKNHYRTNDDGEPSGTAGKPIYGQIQSFGLTDILIAVVRYFGGTKLGTGGLIDAYRSASRMAIESAEIIEKQVMNRYQIFFGYEQMPLVMKVLKEIDAVKKRTTFDTQCAIEFDVAAGAGEKWKESLGNLEGVVLKEKLSGSEQI